MAKLERSKRGGLLLIIIFNNLINKTTSKVNAIFRFGLSLREVFCLCFSFKASGCLVSEVQMVEVIAKVKVV